MLQFFLTMKCICIFCATAYSHSFSEVGGEEKTKVKKKKKNKPNQGESLVTETTDFETDAFQPVST